MPPGRPVWIRWTNRCAEQLRREHGVWADDPTAGQPAWIEFLLGDLLGWGDGLHSNDTALDGLAIEVAEHDTTLTPSFALVQPGEDVKPDTTRLLGMVCEPGHRPTTRLPGSAWAATPVDRVAHLCRHHDVELGLVTDGRWWVLVWAPRGGVTATAVFDSASWAEAADRDVVRAFVSLLSRRRFFGVADGERLVLLLRASLGLQEEITEVLGVQVRRAVELLVAAIGRADVAARERGEPGLAAVDAHDVYRGAVSVMMRVVFLLFAEERGLLPADNELYARAYSAGRLGAELEQRALEGSEGDLEHSCAVYGVDINPMAVEMAKLSLWLVSMDPQRPFTFLDDRLVAGDSLLGITSLDQLECLHMDPKRGRALHEDIFDWTSGVRSLVAEIAAERRRIATIELADDPLAALARKRELLADAELRARQLRLFADLAAGQRSPTRAAGTADWRRVRSRRPDWSTTWRPARASRRHGINGRRGWRLTKSTGRSTATRCTGRWCSRRCSSAADSMPWWATRRSWAAPRSQARWASLTAIM